MTFAYPDAPSYSHHQTWHPSLYEHNTISRLDSPASLDWSEISTKSNEWWKKYNDNQIVPDRYCEEHYMEATQYWRASYWDGWGFLKDVHYGSFVFGNLQAPI